MDLQSQIKENGIVAVIRGANPENMMSIATSLYKGGVKTLEITVDTPNAFALIEKVVAELGKDVIVGAGTVLHKEAAKEAIQAGAQFIFSPNVDVETIQTTKQYGAISIPGALTPTEIVRAYESGGDIIKVFPASAFGPNYLKDIHGPLPHIPLMPTGGIDVPDVREYAKKGAVAVGIGSSLVNTKNEMSQVELDRLVERAHLFVTEWSTARI